MGDYSVRGQCRAGSLMAHSIRIDLAQTKGWLNDSLSVRELVTDIVISSCGRNAGVLF
jgi:hypothetical protein